MTADFVTIPGAGGYRLRNATVPATLLTDLPPGMSVSPDPSLRPGEARITGPWSRAELTREAALAAVAEALREIDPAAGQG